MISCSDEDFQWPGSITISKLIGCLKSTYMFTAENTTFWLVTSYLLPMILWSNKVNKSEYIFQLLHPNEDLLLFLFQFWTCSIASLVISQVWPVASCSTKPGPWEDLLDRLRFFIVRRWGDLRFASGQATAPRQVSVHGCLEDRYAHIYIIYYVYMCVCVYVVCIHV